MHDSASNHSFEARVGSKSSNPLAVAAIKDGFYFFSFQRLVWRSMTSFVHASSLELAFTNQTIDFGAQACGWWS